MSAPGRERTAGSRTPREPGALAVVWAIARKDWRVEGRARDVLGAALFFASLVVVILGLAFGPDPQRLRTAAPGILWVSLAFASVLAAGRAYAAEAEDGALEALLLYPVPHELVYAGKLLGTLGHLLVVALAVVPLTALLTGLEPGPAWPRLALAVGLGTLGMALVASFHSALTVNLRAREALLPVLMFPLVVPVVLGAVKATGLIVTDGPAAEAGAWLSLLVGFDVVYAVACTLAFPLVVEG